MAVQRPLQVGRTRTQLAWQSLLRVDPKSHTGLRRRFVGTKSPSSKRNAYASDFRVIRVSGWLGFWKCTNILVHRTIVVAVFSDDAELPTTRQKRSARAFAIRNRFYLFKALRVLPTEQRARERFASMATTANQRRHSTQTARIDRDTRTKHAQTVSERKNGDAMLLCEFNYDGVLGFVDFAHVTYYQSVCILQCSQCYLNMEVLGHVCNL